MTQSEMAEAWLNHFCRDYFEAQSSGLKPGVINPLVVEVMQEVGIDIAHKKTQSVADLFNRNERFNSVIAVCDEASVAQCPVFPGAIEQIHWSFPDPSKLVGTKEEKLVKIREIRDQIRQKIEEWCVVRCN